MTTTTHRLIYRIENVLQEGAYKSAWAYRWRDDELRHPAPYEDNLSGVRTYELFGFGSMSQFHEWFGLEELDCLVRANAQLEAYATGEKKPDPWMRQEDAAHYRNRKHFLSIIRVPNDAIREGSRQLVFDNSQADRIMTVALDSGLIHAL